MADEATSISRGLNTILKLGVHEKLTKFAKENASDPFGKWSYSLALEMLLEKADRDERYLKLEDRIGFLEYKLQEALALIDAQPKQQEQVKEEAKKPMFLGEGGKE